MTPAGLGLTCTPSLQVHTGLASSLQESLVSTFGCNALLRPANMPQALGTGACQCGALPGPPRVWGSMLSRAPPGRHCSQPARQLAPRCLGGRESSLGATCSVGLCGWRQMMVGLRTCECHVSGPLMCETVHSGPAGRASQPPHQGSWKEGRPAAGLDFSSRHGLCWVEDRQRDGFLVTPRQLL